MVACTCSCVSEIEAPIEVFPQARRGHVTLDSQLVGRPSHLPR